MRVRSVPPIMFAFRPLLGLILLLGFVAPARATGALRTVVFFGDSLTYGYGLDDPSTEAYPARIQAKITAAALPWKVVNAGLSGDTSAGGLRRVGWTLRQPVDVFVLALGANDGLRGIDPAVTQVNLDGIIDRVRSRYPSAEIVVAGMKLPPTMGEDYVKAYDSVFPAVAEEKKALLIPFLLEGVGGVPALNQGDGIHPNAEGARRVADHVWKTLAPLLKRANVSP